MKKRMIAASLTILLLLTSLLPVTVYAKTPAIMASLKSYIQVYGQITFNAGYGYSSKISYQKNKKRFLFQCTYSNGRSTETVRMYMSASKKKVSYKVYFDQTVRASGLTARISGTAKLKRKTYNDMSTNLKFSRKNKTSASRKITNSAYQAAANSLLKYAFKLWERGLETGPTLCFRNFGFNRITVIDGSVYTKEW